MRQEQPIRMHPVMLAITDAFHIARNDIGAPDPDVRSWKAGSRECLDVSGNRGLMRADLETDLADDGRLIATTLTIVVRRTAEMMMRLRTVHDGLAVQTVGSIPATVRAGSAGRMLHEIIAIRGVRLPDVAILAITNGPDDMTTIRIAEDWAEVRRTACFGPDIDTGRNTTMLQGAEES